jgi:hypothetical protein
MESSAVAAERPLSVAITLGEAADRARGTGADDTSGGGRNGRSSAYLLRDTRARRQGAPQPRPGRAALSGAFHGAARDRSRQGAFHRAHGAFPLYPARELCQQLAMSRVRRRGSTSPSSRSDPTARKGSSTSGYSICSLRQRDHPIAPFSLGCGLRKARAAVCDGRYRACRVKSRVLAARAIATGSVMPIRRVATTSPASRGCPSSRSPSV